MLGPDGYLRWVSAGWSRLFGYSEQQLCGQPLLGFVHEDDLEITRQALLLGPALTRIEHLEHRYRHGDGSYRWLLWSTSVQETSTLLYAVVRDITEHKNALARLAESESRYQLLADHSSDAISISTVDGLLTYVSPAGQTVFGWPHADMLGRSVFDFIHPEDIEDAVWQVRSADPDPDPDPDPETGSGILSLARFQRPDGQYRWLESTGQQIRDPHNNQITSVICSTRDVTDRKVAHAALQHQALTDPLTGTANRTLLMDRLKSALRRLDRNPGMVAVFLLDLDRFKVVNDSLGHSIGDDVLRTAAERLLQTARPTDSVGRLGGDEFVVIAEGCKTASDVDELGRRLVSRLREPLQLWDEAGKPGRLLRVTASVGVAVTRRSDHSHEELIREADLALYRAKDRGRDRHELFDEELQSRALLRLDIERTLRRALAEGNLRLAYQPVVRADDLRIVGAEALLRVIGSDGQELQPGSILEVAEETGLIRDLDEWVLTHALAFQAEILKVHPDLFVSLNVTSRDLADHRFGENLQRAIAAAGVPSSGLLLEMTERVLLDTTHSALAGVRRLRELGVGVGVDNFGTGYSSLLYLRSLPLDFLKIDRTFLPTEGPHDLTNNAIMQAVVDLAHALGLTVVAEGVESQAQLGTVQRMGCDRAQGWALHRPMNASKYRKLISAQASSPVS